MKLAIIKGDCFLCLEDYIMDDERIAYTKGKEYISEKDGCITDNDKDVSHEMYMEGDFFVYFKCTKGFNNGWIKIENSDQIITEDYDSLYFVGTMFESGFQQRWGVLSHGGLLSVLEYEKHTHYMKIQKPKPPLY